MGTKKISQGFTCIVCLAMALHAPLAAADRSTWIENVEYLSGFPGESDKARGGLQIMDSEIVFVKHNGERFRIEVRSVTYVAARAEARMRRQTSDVGAAMAAAAVGFIPAVLIFHKRERHLLSIEYLDAEGIAQVALFDIHNHSSQAVKKILDEHAGLTREYYREQDRLEEERKRETEAAMSAAGTWEAEKNIMAGDSQYSRELLEAATYEVILLEGYVGLRPSGQPWAKYRIPLRATKNDYEKREALTPLYRRGRLIGFAFERKRYLFY